mgnify:FL=1
MRAGQLRESISIYEEVTSKDSDFGSTESTFNLVMKTRADVKFISGTELLSNETVSNSSKALFTIRLREGIKETMEIEYRGDRYNIEYIEENRKHRIMKLTTSKILN